MIDEGTEAAIGTARTYRAGPTLPPTAPTCTDLCPTGWQAWLELAGVSSKVRAEELLVSILLQRRRACPVLSSGSGKRKGFSGGGGAVASSSLAGGKGSRAHGGGGVIKCPA